MYVHVFIFAPICRCPGATLTLATTELVSTATYIYLYVCLYMYLYAHPFVAAQTRRLLWRLRNWFLRLLIDR